MVCQIPGKLAEKSYQVLGKLVGGSASVIDNGSQWDPVFVNLGKFISFGGLGPDGCLCLLILSVSVDFLVVVWFFILSFLWESWPVFYQMDG
jgi:hypothetical protein